MERARDEQVPPRRGLQEVARAIWTTGAVALALLLFWMAADVFLLVFAGLLVGVLLTHAARLTARWLRLPYAWSLTAILLGAVIGLGLLGWLMLPRIAVQVDELMARLPVAIESLGQRIETYEWGRAALARIEVERLLPSRSDIVARITGVASTTLGGIVNLFVILFVGIYGATEPHVYSNGFLRLVHPARRHRAREILDELYRTLGWWLVGRLCSMLVIGAATGIGLWLLGVPLALTLGLIAAVLGFVPYIGPIVAGVPAVLIGLTQGAPQALYVLLFYLGLQTLESYLLTPLVQRRALSLPPALQISTQVLAGVLFGVTGLALATPLTAAGQVIVRRAYIEDFLGDRKGVDQ